MTPGLVSITFRQLCAREVVDLVARAGLKSIEWGGDVHVPPGDPKTASEVKKMTSDAGLEVAAYGSYFKVLEKDGSLPEFAPVLESAIALGAPSIRIWAGQINSSEFTPSSYDQLVSRIQEVSAEAAAANIRIATEFHAHTYTDTTDSTLRLLEAVSHSHFDTLWQPREKGTFEECYDSLNQCLPHISNVHVFHWEDFQNRYALKEGASDWMRYFDVFSQDSHPRHFLLEFVKDDSPKQFVEDAATLLRWLEH